MKAEHAEGILRLQAFRVHQVKHLETQTHVVWWPSVWAHGQNTAGTSPFPTFQWERLPLHSLPNKSEKREGGRKITSALHLPLRS